MQVAESLDSIAKWDIVFGNSRYGDRELWMVTEIGEERGDLCRRVNSVVVGELCYWEKGTPVGLLVIDVATEVLFEDRVDSLCLFIGTRMEGC